MNNPFFKDLRSDLAFGLGIGLLLIGLFLLWQPGLTKEERSLDDFNLNQGNFCLDYSHLNQGDFCFDYSHLNQGDFCLDYSHLSFQPREIKVVIPQGSSGFEVGNILAEKGLISARDFRQLIYLFKFQSRIKAGEYNFTSDTSITELLSEILLK